MKVRCNFCKKRLKSLVNQVKCVHCKHIYCMSHRQTFVHNCPCENIEREKLKKKMKLLKLLSKTNTSRRHVSI